MDMRGLSRPQQTYHQESLPTTLDWRIARPYQSSEGLHQVQRPRWLQSAEDSTGRGRKDHVPLSVRIIRVLSNALLTMQCIRYLPTLHEQYFSRVPGQVPCDLSERLSYLLR